jgi:HD-GYP domain-containing protein (c-di-GMP phosphodiesterase class II)
MTARLHTTLSFPDEIDRTFISNVGVAAMLHDLGNQSIPAGLLSAHRPFSPAERGLMETHVAAGIEALSAFPTGRPAGALGLAREIIAGHHEWFDGSGYPSGVRGEAIPLSARLVAVADAFIALTSARPHRPALEAAAAVAAISAEAGRHFDPCIVEAFLEGMDGGFGG